MGILLDKKEIAKIIKESLSEEDKDLEDYEWTVSSTDEEIAKAQALKVLDEQEKPCTCPRDKFSPAIPKRECSFCMLQIRKEVTK